MFIKTQYFLLLSFNNNKWKIVSMNNINLYSNNYQVANSGVNQERIKSSLADSRQAINNSVESNTMAKLLDSTGEEGSNLEKIMLVPLLSFVDKSIDRLMGGPEDKSILKKIANLGDKISNTLHLDKFFNEGRVSKLKNNIKNNRLTKYFTSDYQAVSKSPFAQRSSLASTLKKEVDSKAQEIFKDMKSNVDISEILKSSDSLSASTVKFFKELASTYHELTPDYLTSVRSTLEEVVSKLEGTGFKFAKADEKSINALKDVLEQIISKSENVKSAALTDEITSVLSKLKSALEGNTSINLTDDVAKTLSSITTPKQYSTGEILSVLDDITAKGLKPETLGTGKLSELRNKLKAASSKMGDTLLGRKLAQGTLKTKDIITYGGGLISLFFMASALIHATKAAKEAPKGEKKSTFMHVISEQYLGFILFSPSIQLLYKAGGNKYRGMTVEAKQALKELIQNTNVDENLTREGLKLAKLQRNLLIKGVDKDKVLSLAGKSFKEAKELAKSLKKEGAKLKFWEKPLKFLGKILDMGLDKMQRATYINLPKLGKIKIPKPTFKGFVGGLGRAVIIMMIIQPLIQKPVTKLIHKIFGKPTTYLKKQEEASAAKAQQTKQNVSQSNVPQQNIPQQAQTQQPMQVVQTPSPVQQQGTLSNDTNLLHKWANNNAQLTQQNQPAQNTDVINNPITPAQDNSQTQNNAEIPALNIFKKDDKSNERYIPSIEPIQVQSTDAELDKRVAAIVKENDKIIKQAEKYLH